MLSPDYPGRWLSADLHPSCQSVSQSVETFLILTHAEKDWNLTLS